MTLFQFDCYVSPENSFFYTWLIKVFGIPIVVAMVIAILYWRDLRKRRKGEELDLSPEELDLSPEERSLGREELAEKLAKKLAKTRLKENIFNAVCLLYPWSSSTIISALHCRPLGDGLSVLVHDYQVRCDADWYAYLYWGATLMVILVPLWFSA